MPAGKELFMCYIIYFNNLIFMYKKELYGPCNILFILCIENVVGTSDAGVILFKFVNLFTVL